MPGEPFGPPGIVYISGSAIPLYAIYRLSTYVMMIDEIIIVEGIMNIEGIPSHINVADKTILISAVVAKCPATNIAAPKILFPSCISLIKSAPIPAT